MTDTAFSDLVDPYRRELQAHCRRMLGSLEDPEDMVQETFLRAWRSRATYQGKASFRAWLYRIATNVCLDAIKRRRYPAPLADWDRALEEIAGTDAEPEAEAFAHETFELAFLAAIRHLTPTQRSVLMLRGVAGVSAKDAAVLLDSSVAAVNSNLQRACRTLKERLPRQRLEWTRGSEASDEERALLECYLDAIEHADADEFVAMLCETSMAHG